VKQETPGQISALSREIDRCNQRGGRMFSIVDLVEAGTLDKDLAAFLLWKAAAGASFVVGARPGGAGKTTVMGALIGLVPLGVEALAATDEQVIDQGLSQSEPKRCFICHEIGRGSWYAYLWGRAVRRLFELPRLGHIVATNLHADTLEEAHAQICRDCGAKEEDFGSSALYLFLRVRGARRRIGAVHGQVEGRMERLWEDRDHRHVCGHTQLLEDPRMSEAADLLEDLLQSGAKTTLEVRQWINRHAEGFQRLSR